MENLNAEQIVIEIQGLIKALKANNGWWENRGRGGWFNHDILVDAVAVITSQEQRIKELTEENEAWQKQLISTKEQAGKAYYDLACEVEDLRAENERLRGVGIPDNEVYIRLSDAKHAIMEYACNQTVSKYASAEICKAVRNGAEGAMNELDYITPVKVAPIADTVREMQERLYDLIADADDVNPVSYSQIDQIAKEVLEGTNEEG